MKLQLQHYGSGIYARISILSGCSIAVLSYYALPDEVITTLSGVVKNVWVILGPVGAFAIQIALQLMALGDEKFLTDVQSHRLSNLVNQRLRFIWDFTAITLLALILSMSMSALNPSILVQRLAIALAIGLLALTAALALRFPFLFREIKDFRWRMWRERRDRDEHAATLRAMESERSADMSEVPEPRIVNGSH